MLPSLVLSAAYVRVSSPRGNTQEYDQDIVSYRIVSYRIVSYLIVSNRIVSNRIVYTYKFLPCSSGTKKVTGGIIAPPEPGSGLAALTRGFCVVSSGEVSLESPESVVCVLAPKTLSGYTALFSSAGREQLLGHDSP